jgi:hypothetical protein
MNQHNVPETTLFDLLAREWRRPAPVRQLVFNTEGSLLAVLTADGNVALARLADNEPTESRITVADGQTTIHPRQGKPAPLITTRIEGGRTLLPCQGEGFLVLTDSGGLLKIGTAGEIVGKRMADKSPVLGAAHVPATGLTVAVVPGRLRLMAGAGAAITEIDTGDRLPRALALSPDGSTVALAGNDWLSLVSTTGQGRVGDDIPIHAPPLALSFSDNGRWLGCGFQKGGLCLVEVASGRHGLLADFPAPVTAIAWGSTAETLLAAGAYRIVGWDLARPPLTDPTSGAIATGRGGFVTVSALAAHPRRPLVAAGYANGQLLVAPIGSSDALALRAGGGPVTVLAWSGDGRHLAVGDALGQLAIVTFPERLFK